MTRRAAVWMLVTLAMLLLVPVVHGQQKVLQVGLATADQIEYYEQVLVPEFERRYPNVKVEVSNIFWGPDPYILRYIGGNPPDVFQTGGDKLGAYLDMIVPLDGSIERAGWEANLVDFPAPIIDSLTVNGQLMALPWNYAVRQFTYRKDLFESAGLDADTPPITWDDLVEYGRNLTVFNPDGAMVRQGLYTREHYINFHPFLAQAGGDWMNADLTQATFADDRAMEAIQFKYELFHVHRISDADTRRGGLQGLAAGQAAMEYMTQTPFVSTDPNPYFSAEDIGVAPPLRHHVQSQLVLPSTWHITDVSQLHDEAWNWIEFVLEAEIVRQKAQAQNLIPVRISVGAQYEPWTDDPRWATTFQNLSYSSTVAQASPYFNDLRRWQMNGLGRVLFDGESPTVMAEEQRLANVWLQEQLAR